MHKHHHCCKCPECYEVTRMAALRRMEPPSYGEWQHEQYGYGGYGSQTLPAPGGAAPAARGKAKLGPPARDPAALKPPPPPAGKNAPKVNGSGPGWWPECTCSSRDWYEQVRASPGQRLPGDGTGRAADGGSPRESGRVVAGCSITPGASWVAGVDAGVVAVGHHRCLRWPPALLRLASPLLRLAIVVLPSVGALHGSSFPGAELGQLGLTPHRAGVWHGGFQTPHPRSSPLTMPLPEAPAVSRASCQSVFGRRGACCSPGSLVGSRCRLPALPNWHLLSIELWFPRSAATSLLPEIIT